MSRQGARYPAVAAAFAHRVRAVDADGWSRPAPCDGWLARDVVGHLVAWVPGFFDAFAGLATPALPPVEADPAAAWSALDAAVRSWLADPSIAGRAFTGPMGETTVAQAIDQFVTPDVLVHTWDLARATGLDDRLDPAEIDGLVEAMEPIDAQLRASGHYGPRVAVDPGASAQDRLLAFLGRDPHWAPPHGGGIG